MKKESAVWRMRPPSISSSPLRKKASGPLAPERTSKLKGTSTPGRSSKTPRHGPRAEKTGGVTDVWLCERDDDDVTDEALRATAGDADDTGAAGWDRSAA